MSHHVSIRYFLDLPAVILAPSTSARGVICLALSIGHMEKHSPFASVFRSANSETEKHRAVYVTNVTMPEASFRPISEASELHQVGPSAASWDRNDQQLRCKRSAYSALEVLSCLSHCPGLKCVSICVIYIYIHMLYYISRGLYFLHA